MIRDKVTGEIRKLHDGVITLLLKDENQIDDPDFIRYRSIKELCDKWEDYKELKEYWYIDDAGVIQIDQVLSSEINMRKAIGNYFDTREEAELAVRRLKAWKLMKDFGCGFILDDNFTVKFVGPDVRKIASAKEQKSLSDAYKLLFGGEE